MKYIAITRQTASWMLTRPKLIVALHDLIVQDDQLLMLRCADLTEGPFRLSGYQDGKLLAILNLDYLTGTGTEEWGFIKLSSPFGLLDRLEFSQEVLERSLYLVNQRLQGLLIDSVYYHRNWDNGAQTCLAGRGTETRHSSIGYCESDVALGSMRSHAIMCVGPSEDLDDVSRAAAEEGRNLPALVKLANEMIAPQRRRPVLNRSLFASLRDKILNQDAASNQGLEDITVSSLSVPTARDV